MMMEIMKKAACVITILMFVWFIWSWADVLAHNSPCNPTDCSRYNAFTVLLGIE